MLGVQESMAHGGRSRFEGVVTPPLPVWERVAGAVFLIAIAATYLWLGGTWWVGLALLLAPDLAFLGFAVSARAGVAAYNAVHRPAMPAILLAVAIIASWRSVLLLALIWLAHITMDRAAGYGLKQFRHGLSSD